MKKILLFALCACILFACSAFAKAEAEFGYELGNRLEDFSVTTIAGETFTLSEVLKEKDMVLINIWASWCGPCRNEFPHMQKAYDAYKDDIEIIAVSCEPTDSVESLTEFAANLGLTFPIAQDTLNLAGKFGAYSIPTSIVVDRYGVICYKVSGSLPSVESFTRLFDAFVGDNYASSELYTTLPAFVPSIEPTAPEFLKDALDIASDRITIKNPTNKYVWPMTVTMTDGIYVVSANAGVHDSKSQIDFVIDAKAGEAFKLTFSVFSEAVCDLVRITVNGDTVKLMSGERENISYSIPFSADGEYTVSVTYEKDNMYSVEEDRLYLYSAALLSGENAEKALTENPVYPASSDSIILKPASAETRKIEFTDPDNMLINYFGETEYYITNLDTVTFLATLSHDIDPEGVFGYSTYDGVMLPAFEAIEENAYAFTTSVDSLETTGYIATVFFLYLTPDDYNKTVNVTLLRDEAAANLIVSQAIGTEKGAWHYADEEASSLNQGPVDYTLAFKDASGAPVSGVMAQVCTDEICMVYFSDANGLCTFTLDPYAYEVHILKAPDGYAYDSGEFTLLSPAGGTTEFVLKTN